MTNPTRPARMPASSCFSSGPCAKRPGWTPRHLGGAALGRSHRAAPARDRLRDAIRRTRQMLQVPASHKIAIVPASDTGAVELALWSLLGARGVDILAWESFGKTWLTDIVGQLKLDDVRIFEAPYGSLPDLREIDRARDVVFTYNGTTSGVCVPDCDWISDNRAGLTICDATSAAFAMPLDFSKLDVTTFSWQKALGGEAGFGMVVLSPRACQRFTTYQPPWPVPKIFRLTNQGRFLDGLFDGATINTPSLLCVEDYLDALGWAEAIGGLDALIARAQANAGAVAEFVARTPWLDHLAGDAAVRSTTSVCLSIVDPAIAACDDGMQRNFVKAVAARLAREGAGHDIAAYRAAPPGFRIWCGATIERTDIEILLEWLDWAFKLEKSSLGTAVPVSDSAPI